MTLTEIVLLTLVIVGSLATPLILIYLDNSRR